MTMRQPAVSTIGREEPQTLPSWNVVVAAKDHEQRHLARCVKRLGDFWWTPFLGLLVGRVADHDAFCEQLRRSEEERPGFLRPLARLIPIDRTFTFQVEHLPAQLEQLSWPMQTGSTAARSTCGSNGMAMRVTSTASHWSRNWIARCSRIYGSRAPRRSSASRIRMRLSQWNRSGMNVEWD